MAVQGTDEKENRAFIGFAKHFLSKGLNVPEVYGVSQNGLEYLQQDLGSEDLLSYGEKMQLKAISMLPSLQVLGSGGLDFGLCHPIRKFDRRSIMFDLNYFKYCYLKPSEIAFDELRLEDDFESLASDLLEYDSEYFMYRDFQARNVMVYGGEPYFIDFQGGRRGPLQYDLVSFVYEPKSEFSKEFKRKLIDEYIASLKGLLDIDEESFRASIPLFALLRLLQVFGCYGFRGLIEKKELFLSAIPLGLRLIPEVLEALPEGRYEYLREVFKGIANQGKHDAENI